MKTPKTKRIALSFFAMLCIFAAPIPAVAQDRPLDYEDAKRIAEQDNKPLMVIVTAKWCAPCQTLKRLIDSMKLDLKLTVVCFIDLDERPTLARQFMRGESIPQLVLFRQQDNKRDWKRFRLIGPQTRARILELINAR